GPLSSLAEVIADRRPLCSTRREYDTFSACRDPKSMSRPRYRASTIRLGQEPKRWLGEPGRGAGGRGGASTICWSRAKQSFLSYEVAGTKAERLPWQWPRSSHCSRSHLE